MNQSELNNSIHFLVVDDDAESRATVVEYLRAMGFSRLTLAHDGTEAIRLLDRDTTINFIISDWDMPMMNGLTLLQRVKLNPGRAQIPFLVMTSPVSAEAEKVILAAENLVDAYLIKPFRCQMLLEKIQKLLAAAMLGLHKQVVVVDDDVDAQEMVVEYVKQMGFDEVVTYSDGVEALKYISANPKKVGMIISDWEMPKMTGIELLRACKAEPEMMDIPFLMVTSQTSIERLKIMQAARASVDQYLLKPFNSTDFKSRVEGVLERSKFNSEVRKLNNEGLENFENGRYQVAQSKFEEALTFQPENELALRGMAEIVAKQKGWQAALQFFKRAVEANPGNAKNYLRLGHAYEQLGWIDRAVALFESATQQVAFSAELHFALGKVYCRRSMYERAQIEFEKTLEIQSDHKEARLMLNALEIQRKGSEK